MGHTLVGLKDIKKMKIVKSYVGGDYYDNYNESINVLDHLLNSLKEMTCVLNMLCKAH